MNPAGEALEPVLRDVGASVTEIMDGTTVPPGTVVLLGGEGTRWEVELDLAASPTERIVDVAEHVQDLIADLLHREGLPAAWPGCPAHPGGHPLVARAERSGAVWVCPAGAGVPLPIGALPQQEQRIGSRRPPTAVPQRPDEDQPLEPMIDAALAPVLRDLRTTGGPAPRIEDARWGHAELQATARLSGESAASGVSVDRREGPPQQIVQAADGAQEWAIDERWRMGLPTNWPVCPVHPDTHPLRAELRDSVPTWCCPLLDRAIAPIGALPASSGSIFGAQ